MLVLTSHAPLLPNLLLTEQVIAHLKNWHTELSARSTFDSIPEKAQHIGLLNSIEVAIKQLELCQTYGINPGSWFCVFPKEVFRLFAGGVQGGV
ncbi:MAG TPA: hypothetical protein VG733_14150 [Chthoniobacteraceae bacterium]|nr:hypothetical protein [Chthoniobacteraceae bacterium]